MDPSRTLFVANIPGNVSDDVLYAAFRELGAVSWNRVGSTSTGFLSFRGDLQVKSAMAVMDHLELECTCDSERKSKIDSIPMDPRLKPEATARKIQSKFEAGATRFSAPGDNTQGPDGTLTDMFDTEGIPVEDIRHDIRIWRAQTERLRTQHRKKIAAAVQSADKTKMPVSSELQQQSQPSSSKWEEFLRGVSDDLSRLAESCEALSRRKSPSNASADMRRLESQSPPKELSPEWYERRRKEMEWEEQDRQAERNERSGVFLQLNITASRATLEKAAQAVCGTDPSESEDRAEIVEFLEDLLPAPRSTVDSELTDLLGEEDASRVVEILTAAA